jgi:hypothetical protein
VGEQIQAAAEQGDRVGTQTHLTERPWPILDCWLRGMVCGSLQAKKSSGVVDRASADSRKDPPEGSAQARTGTQLHID